MKVAINCCFGGFGISDEAFEKLLNRKGIAFEKIETDSKLSGTNYYKAGHIGDDNYYLNPYDYYEPRNDPDLIAVIEEMGEQSFGWAAEISIVEIPDDVEWYVEEYDGREHVAEKHRTWC
jgi:hypothetical protein